MQSTDPIIDEIRRIREIQERQKKSGHKCFTLPPPETAEHSRDAFSLQAGRQTPMKGTPAAL